MKRLHFSRGGRGENVHGARVCLLESSCVFQDDEMRQSSQSKKISKTVPIWHNYGFEVDERGEPKNIDEATMQESLHSHSWALSVHAGAHVQSNATPSGKIWYNGLVQCLAQYQTSLKVYPPAQPKRSFQPFQNQKHKCKDKIRNKENEWIKLCV